MISYNRGFTLVEISIVLVIIGLLLGGVLKGQELITNAKISSVMNDFKSIKAAHYAYIDRTGLMSGDTRGNGKISDDSIFWRGIYTEGFIAGVVSSVAPPPPPPDPFGNDAPRITDNDLSGVRHALDGVFYVGGNDDLFEGKNYVCASNIRTSHAMGMDLKLDDGNALTGSVRSLIGLGAPEKESDIDDHLNPTENYESDLSAPSHICMVM